MLIVGKKERTKKFSDIVDQKKPNYNAQRDQINNDPELK